jgi:hypothetical protein
MATKYKIGTLTVADQLKMESAIRREQEIATGMRINHHRVQRSKKSYTRKDKHKLTFA